MSANVRPICMQWNIVGDVCVARTAGVRGRAFSLRYGNSRLWKNLISHRWQSRDKEITFLCISLEEKSIWQMWWGARAIYCGWNKEEAGSLCIGLVSLAFNSRSAQKYQGVHGGQTHPGRFTPCNINVEPRQRFWTSEKESKKVFDVSRSHLRIRRNASIIGNHLGFQTRTTTLQGRANRKWSQWNGGV